MESTLTRLLLLEHLLPSLLSSWALVYLFAVLGQNLPVMCVQALPFVGSLLCLCLSTCIQLAGMFENHTTLPGLFAF